MSFYVKYKQPLSWRGIIKKSSNVLIFTFDELNRCIEIFKAGGLKGFIY